MCGRIRLPTDHSEIKRKLKLGHFAAPNLRPTWNLAPTQDVLCVIRDPVTNERKPVKMHWGLIPKWAKEAKMKFATFNAKAETLTEKATFHGAWSAGRRCLVVTDGFYEWRKSDKQPFAISCAAGDLTVMAGLWEEWIGSGGEIVTSCTIVTTNANELLASVHDRMPVILAESDWPRWLGETPALEEQLLALLRPYPASAMKSWPVSKRVGNVRNDDAALVDEVPLSPLA